MNTVFYVTPHTGPPKLHPIIKDGVYGILGAFDSAQPAILAHLPTALHHLQDILTTTDVARSALEIKHALTAVSGGYDYAIVVTSVGKVRLFTQGTGVIFIKRAGAVKELVSSGDCADGVMHPGDIFIMTTSEYLDLIGGTEGFTYYFTKYPPQEVYEMMTTYESSATHGGFLACGQPAQIAEGADPSVIVTPPEEHISSMDTEVSPPLETVETTIEPDGSLVTEVAKPSRFALLRRVTSWSTAVVSRIRGIRLNRIPSWRTWPKRTVIAVGVGIVLLALIIKTVPMDSLFRDADAEFTRFEKKIGVYITDAETESFVNPAGVKVILDRARGEIDALSDGDARRYLTRITALQKSIATAEKTLMRLVDVRLEEQYAFAIKAKEARIVDADATEKYIYGLDAERAVIYRVETARRSAIEIRSNKLKNAQQIAVYEDRIYVLTQSEGVYLISEDASTRVLRPDPQWGTISDMRVYASNIYVLDSKAGAIYKYNGIDEATFGTSSPYLVEELQGTLTDVQGLTIDGSVYVYGGAKVRVFVSGRVADQSYALPSQDMQIAAVTTTGADGVRGETVIADARGKTVLQFDDDGIYTSQFATGEENVIFMKKNTTGLFLVSPQRVLLVKPM